jgi:hypothetical protein
MGRDDINSLALVRTENELGHPQIQIRSQNTDSTPGHAKAAREGLATARPVVFAASAGRFWISQRGDLMV